MAKIEIMSTLIQNNIIRVGNFTSSEIVSLTSMGSRDMTLEELAARPKKGKGSSTTKVPDGLGDTALTYINERNWERQMNRPLDAESNARPLSWGLLCEKRVFELLPIEYQLVSKDTIVHPDYDSWSGTPDANKFDEGNTVVDIKCPITPKSFCTLVDPLYNGLEGIDAMNAIRFGYTNLNGLDIKKHPDGDKFFYQLVSNSILTGSKYAELIVYCPYKSELESIRELASQIDDPFEQRKFYLLSQATDDELPWLHDGGLYKNINIIRFEVPEEDKRLLTERVKQCSKLLIPRR